MEEKTPIEKLFPTEENNEVEKQEVSLKDKIKQWVTSDTAKDIALSVGGFIITALLTKKK